MAEGNFGTCILQGPSLRDAELGNPLLHRALVFLCPVAAWTSLTRNGVIHTVQLWFVYINRMYMCVYMYINATLSIDILVYNII